MTTLCPCGLVLWCVADELRGLRVFRHFDEYGKDAYYVRFADDPVREVHIGRNCPYMQEDGGPYSGKRIRIRRIT